MASTTSVISFFVLLFVTYSYCAPVAPKTDNPVRPFQSTTGTTTIEHQSAAVLDIVRDDQSTGASNTHKVRSMFVGDNFEPTVANHVADARHDVENLFSTRLVEDSDSKEGTTPSGESVGTRSAEDSDSKEGTTPSGESLARRSVGDSDSEEGTTPSGEYVATRSVGDSDLEEGTTPSGESFGTRSVGDSDPEEGTTPTDPTFSSRDFVEPTMESSTGFDRRGFPEDFQKLGTPTPKTGMSSRYPANPWLSTGDSTKNVKAPKDEFSSSTEPMSHQKRGVDGW